MVLSLKTWATFAAHVFFSGFSTFLGRRPYSQVRRFKSTFLKKKAKIDLPIQRLSLMTLGYIEMAAFGSETHTGTSHIDIIV
jgi:hypothetical protein